jgi:hypothetical protein
MYLGCVITNYLAFQEFINYPLTFQQVSNAYHEALVYDYDVLKMQAKTGMNYVHVPQAPELIYPHTTKEQILWVNKKDYPEEMCFKLYALDQLPETRPRMRYHDIRYLRGCPLRSGALHEEICKYINHFDPEELRLKAVGMRVKANRGSALHYLSNSEVFKVVDRRVKEEDAERTLLSKKEPNCYYYTTKEKGTKPDSRCIPLWLDKDKPAKEKEEEEEKEEVPQPFEPGCTRIWLGEEEEDPCVKEKKEEENMAKLVQEAMDNINDPKRRTTFEHYPPCDCAKWVCEKKEEKKEEDTPKVACMAIGCPGSEPK